MNIEARPYPFALSTEVAALVIIDMQRDFLQPGGFGSALGNDVSQLAKVVEPTQRLLAAARDADLLIVHTREGHRPDLADLAPAKHRRGKASLRIGDRGPMGRILVRGEPGHEIVPELEPLPGEPVVDKPGKGSFYATDLELILRSRGIRTVIMTGVATNVCVETTARQAFLKDYYVVFTRDGTATYTQAEHDGALANIDNYFGEVVSCDDIAACWQPVAMLARSVFTRFCPAR